MAMKKLGLVGGISWVSTLDYYRLINEGINERLGGLNFAECMIYSLNFGDVQAAHWDNSFDLLLHACKALKSSGAEGLVLCANTAHIFSRQLAEQTGLPLIDIVTATAKAVSSRGFHRIGLLGTKFTMEMDFFRSGLHAHGIEVLIPALPETRDYIQHTLKEELGKGIVNPETRAAYVSIIAELVEQGAEAIILACTEIPLLVNQNDLQVTVFDTTQIHAQAAVNFALST